MMPVSRSPMKAMNKPIPAVMPCFRFSGIASISFFRKGVNDRMIKMIPATKTAANAVI
ncbi:Uncharacterised protein [Mycobacteroides abscessus subsp. abscessus]|nr:Uncharacterised protein [Mycobacteroides abscessus subsp. abscessus]